MSKDIIKTYRHMAKRLCSNIAIGFTGILLISMGVVLVRFKVVPAHLSKNNNPLAIYNHDYDVTRLDNSKENREIKFGYAIFQNCPKYLGSDKDHPDRAYSGNGLSCTNCHLWSGTKPYAAPLIGIIQRFPQFRGRENEVGTIEERINGCMERSMNGKKMPADTKEMKAMVSYLNWLSRFAPDNGNIVGQGFVNIELPNKAVDLKHGETVFKKHCITCHGRNGAGEKSKDGMAYIYPPLWGNDSYNNGAGMTRVITAAQFIKANMPFGTTYENPVLTDEEAYDVAGYINQHLRPSKPNLNLDFPDLKKKPISTPYPPYADTFGLKQHQLGPFRPIMDYYKNEYTIVKSK